MSSSSDSACPECAYIGNPTDCGHPWHTSPQVWNIADQIMEDSTGWFGEEIANDLVTTVLGINGEAGEVADIVKKVLRGSLSEEDPKVVGHLCEELVDVFIYTLMAARILNFDIVKGYMEKREYNHRRFTRDASSTDQPAHSAEVRRQQQAPLGASAFVGEREVRG